MELSDDMRIAIAFAKLELVELEAGKRELHECPGLRQLADAIPITLKGKTRPLRRLKLYKELFE